MTTIKNEVYFNRQSLHTGEIDVVLMGWIFCTEDMNKEERANFLSLMANNGNVVFRGFKYTIHIC